MSQEEHAFFICYNVSEFIWINKIIPATISTIILLANSVIPINIKLVLISTDTLSIKIEVTYVIRAIPARILPGTNRFKPFCFNVIYAKIAVIQSVIIQRTIISFPPSQAFSFYYTWHCPIIVIFTLMWHITRNHTIYIEVFQIRYSTWEGFNWKMIL